jgi:NAD-dependent dihydropyrimidine dehydrogenase PreA subunit
MTNQGLIDYIETLSIEERKELFYLIRANFCIECGSNIPRCQCWNDE